MIATVAATNASSISATSDGARRANRGMHWDS
jgi:hypothetical protein